MTDDKDLRDRPIGSPEGPPAPASSLGKLRELFAAVYSSGYSDGSDMELDLTAAVQKRQPLLDRIVREAAGALQPRAHAERWQPIATAPKDGTQIDVWCSSPDGVNQWRLAACWWDKRREKWVNHTGMYDVATHWMPLSAPPGAALREATPATEKEGYGNARCVCGHLSSHHNCDHATSDTSCFDCGCEAFATIRKDQSAAAPPLSREAPGELKSSVMTQDSDDQLVRRVEGRLFARLADLISAPQTPRPVLHGDGWFTGEGGIVIEAHCATCQQPYPTYSVSSQMRCPDCRQRYECALAALLPPQEPTL